MLMDNTLELLVITDSNIKITRFSAESVNGEKRNVIEAHWRLFHKDSADLEAARSVYLRGVNEYMTQQNALDLIVKNRGFARTQRMEHRLRQRCICQKSHS